MLLGGSYKYRLTWSSQGNALIMPNNNDVNPWSTANIAAFEASLWRVKKGLFTDLPWLDLSWKEPVKFWRGLHGYWKLQQAVQTKSMPLECYDFYHDLLVKSKDDTSLAYVWFDGDVWQAWSYAELRQAVDGLAASWEKLGVQPEETVAILHQQGPQTITAILAGLRLGLVITLLPPQGDSFVQHRLKTLKPQRLVMDQFYQSRLAEVWQKLTLPNTLSSSSPMRQPYLYPAKAVVLQSFDPTSLTPDVPCLVDADTLYLGALRDGIFALGLKAGQSCAAPDWHSMESQPALILAVLLRGATWVHIDLVDIEENTERLLEQPIDVLGVSRRLRDVLRHSPPSGEKPWQYWFRHPAESADLTLWQDFIEQLQLQECYVGNLLWNSSLGGAIFFSARYRGLSHHESVPTAGLLWQFGKIADPELPCLDNSGRIALGKEIEGEVVWTATPHILAIYLDAWHYLGNYPRGRAGRTYLRDEVMAVLLGCESYIALIEVFVLAGDTDPRQVLLVFGEGVDTDALLQRVEFELGAEFLPDRIECLSLFPKLDEGGGVDQGWCQLHYQTGELYRRERSEIFRCVSELKRMVLL